MFGVVFTYVSPLSFSAKERHHHPVDPMFLFHS